MTDNIVALDIPGARGKVELKGAQGIFFSILIDGVAIKRKRGAWSIPMRNGDTARLTSHGFIPGFSTLSVDGKEIYKVGAHVTTAERALMFLPMVLIIFSYIGAAVGVVLVFMNILGMKIPTMPRGMRIALPIMNTLAGAVMSVLLFTLLNG